MLKRICNHITSYHFSLVLIGLMFMLPFIILHHKLPIPSFYNEWIAAVLGMMAIIPMLSKVQWQSLQLPQISLIFPGLAAILLMQWMLEMVHSTHFALLVFSYLIFAFFLVVLGANLRRELGWEKLVTTLAMFVVFGGLVNVGIVIVQYAVLNGFSIPLMPDLKSFGAISQKNHMANYAALATASLIYLYAKGHFSLKKFFFVLALFMVVLSVSGSRSSWLYLFAFTVLAIFMQVNAMRQRTGSTMMRSLLRVSLLLLPAFALAQMVIHLVMPNTLVELPTERLFEGATATSASVRFQFWFDSMRLFFQSPWLGIGAGAMREHTFLLLDSPAEMASGRIFEHAHNLFLHLLTEMGVGAFLLVAAGLVAWMRGFKWRELSLETWWLLAMLAVLGIHSMLEYPLWYVYFLGIAAVLFGAGDEKLTALKLPRLTNQLGRACLLVFLIVGTVNLVNLVVANARLEHWLQRALQGDISAQAQPKFYEMLQTIHSQSLLSPYAELMYATTLIADHNRLDDKLFVSQSSMRFIPMRKIAYRHVLLLKLKGDHAGAVKQLNRTLLAFPGKFTDDLQMIPIKYWQDYLEVLFDARPVKKAAAASK